MASVKFYFFFIAVLSLSFLMSCDCMTLEEYCFMQLPPTKRIFKSKIGFMPFIHMCSHIEAYTECLLFTREWDVPGIEIEIYEKNFPAADDMYKAGYIFCTEELYTKWHVYRYNEDAMARCEQTVKYDVCRRQVSDILDRQRLKANIQNCNLTVAYYRCLRESYSACQKIFQVYFDYFLARVGVQCLISQKEPNRMLLTNVCPRQDFRSLNEGYITRSLKWPIIAALGCVINAMQISA